MRVNSNGELSSQSNLDLQVQIQNSVDQGTASTLNLSTPWHQNGEVG